MTSRIIHGEALETLRSMPDASVDCCVTSPPYWRLRNYGDERQLGQEPSVRAYVDRLVEILREVRRVLSPSGTLWLNLGDSRIGAGGGGQGPTGQRANRNTRKIDQKKPAGEGLKYKDLVGVPWRVALALQDDGWWLRSDIIWHKPNPTPGSQKDRPTDSHEYLFLLSKSEVYFYNHAQARESSKTVRNSSRDRRYRDPAKGFIDTHNGQAFPWAGEMATWRSVWSIVADRVGPEHCARMPVELAHRCVIAGCPESGTVLDPFCGSGTTGLVASRLDRNFVGIELIERDVLAARERIRVDAPLLNARETGT